VYSPRDNLCCTAALRLIDLAVRRGFNVNVFTYEGKVSRPSAQRSSDAGSASAADRVRQNDVNPRDLIAAMFESAERGTQVRWVNCGLSVDDRRTARLVPRSDSCRSFDLWGLMRESGNTLVLPTS